MINYIDHKKMGRGIQPWLDSHFHFSFADYYNPDNIQFGVLRVINDDLIKPKTGFDTHPHKDMEILTYVIDGELSHRDSMGHERTLKPGQVQYMSAGTGVLHSEHNLGEETLRLLQVWILPDKMGVEPNYGEVRFTFEDRFNKWLPIATSYENENSEAPITIHADINMYATIISNGEPLEFKVDKNRQAYLVLIEGKVEVNGQILVARDALEILEEDIIIQPVEQPHMLMIEMAKPV